MFDFSFMDSKYQSVHASSYLYFLVYSYYIILYCSVMFCTVYVFLLLVFTSFVILFVLCLDKQ